MHFLTRFFHNGKKILILSTPIIFAQLGNVLLGITDTIMVGQVGKDHLAAVGVSNQIFFLVTIIGMGIMTALTTLIASSKGAENKKECGEFLRSGIELSLLISVGLFILLIILSYQFWIFGQPEEVNVIAGRYLRILSVSVFPLLLFLSFKHFNDGLSLSKPAMIITFVGVGLNIFFNWIFIYGHYSIPPMHAAGAALATLITRILMALMLAGYVFYSRASQAYLPSLVSTYKTRPVIRKLLKIGLPTGLQIFFEAGAYSLATIMAGWISLAALASHQIGMALIALAYMIASGIATAVSVLVSFNFAQHKTQEIQKTGTSGLLITFISMLGVATFLIFFQQHILEVFTHDHEVLSISMTVFTILVVYQLLNGIQSLLTGALRGIQDVSFPAKFTLVAYWCLAVPLAFFMGNYLRWGLKGVWLGLLSGLLLSSTTLFIRFRQKVKSGKLATFETTALEAK